MSVGARRVLNTYIRIEARAAGAFGEVEHRGRGCRPDGRVPAGPFPQIVEVHGPLDDYARAVGRLHPAGEIVGRVVALAYDGLGPQGGPRVRPDPYAGALCPSIAKRVGHLDLDRGGPGVLHAQVRFEARTAGPLGEVVGRRRRGGPHHVVAARPPAIVDKVGRSLYYDPGTVGGLDLAREVMCRVVALPQRIFRSDCRPGGRRDAKPDLLRRTVAHHICDADLCLGCAGVLHAEVRLVSRAAGAFGEVEGR
jgi:hypothetical protein